MTRPATQTVTLTMPTRFAFKASEWISLNTRLAAVAQASPLTYLVEQAADSVLIQEINPPVPLAADLAEGLIITRTQMGYELTAHASAGQASADLMSFALLIHAASGTKVKLSSDLRSPEPWHAARSSLVGQHGWSELAGLNIRVGVLKVRQPQ